MDAGARGNATVIAPASSIAEPARRIVDLAQSGLSVDDFAAEVLGVLDSSFGVDNAFAIRCEAGAPLIAHNADSELSELAARTLDYRTTKYAADLMPAFTTSERRGGCLDSEFFPSERSKLDSPYFREVLAPVGARSMMLLCASWKGRPLLRLTLNRHGMQCFRKEDLERALHLLPTLEASVVASMANDIAQAPSPLTAREKEISELVARGLTNGQIATVLGTSAFTVRNQLSRIFEKLHLESRTELAVHVVSTWDRQPG